MELEDFSSRVSKQPVILFYCKVLFILLIDLGIKAVLTSCYEASDLKYDQNIVPYHLFIEGRDDYLFNIYDHFDPCVDWISQHIRFTNVLVHCIGGKSRSASLVLAYLIREKGMSYEDSLNYVKGIRKIVNFNFI
jgi:protein-tyrosine phosphatase